MKPGIYLELRVNATQHPSVMVLRDESFSLWIHSLCWSATSGTERWISRAGRIELGGSKRSADELAASGLWLPDVVAGDSGHWIVENELWRIHRYGLHRVAVPQWMRDAVLIRDGYACLHCGARDDLQMDHTFPWSRGGETTVENLQTLCGPCNRFKGARV